MTDPLLDDVKALLEKDFGDDRILKQIRRACENDEVISNYERNYVRKLAEKYLNRRPEISIPKPELEKPIVPDIPIPQSSQNYQSLQRPEPPTTSSSNSKNSKILISIGGIALVIIIALVVSFSGISPVATNPTNVVTPSTDVGPLTLSIKTDVSNYNENDLISISGTSDISGFVDLSIENDINEIVWTESVPVKKDGGYSTLTIAGGPGWEDSGSYTIKVTNSKETKSENFSFSK